MDILRFLFIPANFFIGHPERACVMALAFGALWAALTLRNGFKSETQLPMVLTALLWAAYALEESYAMQRGWNIRVDLLLLWPPLFAVTIVAAWAGIRSLIASPSKPPEKNIQNGNAAGS